MNSRLVSLLMFFLAVPSLSLADDTALKKLVKEKVNQLSEATAKGDYAKIADLTHTRVIQSMGGRDDMIAQTQKAMKQMKQEGMEIKSFKVGEPSAIVKQGTDLYVYVPNELIYKTKDGRIISQSYVVGVSYDQGKTWTFANSDSTGNIKKLFPNFPEALKIPEAKKPIVEKN